MKNQIKAQFVAIDNNGNIVTKKWFDLSLKTEQQHRSEVDTWIDNYDDCYAIINNAININVRHIVDTYIASSFFER